MKLLLKVALLLFISGVLCQERESPDGDKDQLDPSQTDGPPREEQVESHDGHWSVPSPEEVQSFLEAVLAPPPEILTAECTIDFDKLDPLSPHEAKRAITAAGRNATQNGCFGETFNADVAAVAPDARDYDSMDTTILLNAAVSMPQLPQLVASNLMARIKSKESKFAKNVCRALQAITDCTEQKAKRCDVKYLNDAFPRMCARRLCRPSAEDIACVSEEDKVEIMRESPARSPEELLERMVPPEAITQGSLLELASSMTVEQIRQAAKQAFETRSKKEKEEAEAEELEDEEAKSKKKKRKAKKADSATIEFINMLRPIAAIPVELQSSIVQDATAIACLRFSEIDALSADAKCAIPEEGGCPFINYAGNVLTRLCRGCADHWKAGSVEVPDCCTADKPTSEILAEVEEATVDEKCAKARKLSAMQKDIPVHRRREICDNLDVIKQCMTEGGATVDEIHGFSMCLVFDGVPAEGTSVEARAAYCDEMATNHDIPAGKELTKEYCALQGMPLSELGKLSGAVDVEDVGEMTEDEAKAALRDVCHFSRDNAVKLALWGKIEAPTSDDYENAGGCLCALGEAVAAAVGESEAAASVIGAIMENVEVDDEQAVEYGEPAQVLECKQKLGPSLIDTLLTMPAESAGQGRRRKRQSQNGEITCQEVQAAASPDAFSAEQIANMSVSVFDNCPDSLQTVKSASLVKNYAARLVELKGSPSNWTVEDNMKYGCILLGLTPQLNVVKYGNTTDLINKIGSCSVPMPDNSGYATIWGAYATQSGETVDALDAPTIQGMGNVFCGLSADQMAMVPKEAINGSLTAINGLKCYTKEQVMSLKGDMPCPTTQQGYSDMGMLVAACPVANIAPANVEHILKDAIPLMTISNFSYSQIMMMTKEQAMAVTPEQLASLDAAAKQCIESKRRDEQCSPPEESSTNETATEGNTGGSESEVTESGAGGGAGGAGGGGEGGGRDSTTTDGADSSNGGADSSTDGTDSGKGGADSSTNGTDSGNGGSDGGSDGSSDGTTDSGNGGTDSGNGGTDSGDGGTNGTDSGNGGTDSGTGGTDSGNGGTDSGNGGTDSGNGGTDSGNGGTDSGNGGTDGTDTNESVKDPCVWPVEASTISASNIDEHLHVLEKGCVAVLGTLSAEQLGDSALVLKLLGKSHSVPAPMRDALCQLACDNLNAEQQQEQAKWYPCLLGRCADVTYDSLTENAVSVDTMDANTQRAVKGAVEDEINSVLVNAGVDDLESTIMESKEYVELLSDDVMAEVVDKLLQEEGRIGNALGDTDLTQDQSRIVANAMKEDLESELMPAEGETTVNKMKAETAIMKVPTCARAELESMLAKDFSTEASLAVLENVADSKLACGHVKGEVQDRQVPPIVGVMMQQMRDSEGGFTDATTDLVKDLMQINALVPEDVSKVPADKMCDSSSMQQINMGNAMAYTVMAKCKSTWDENTAIATLPNGYSVAEMEAIPASADTPDHIQSFCSRQHHLDPEKYASLCQLIGKRKAEDFTSSEKLKKYSCVLATCDESMLESLTSTSMATLCKDMAKRSNTIVMTSEKQNAVLARCLNVTSLAAMGDGGFTCGMTKATFDSALTCDKVLAAYSDLSGCVSNVAAAEEIWKCRKAQDGFSLEKPAWADVMMLDVMSDSDRAAIPDSALCNVLPEFVEDTLWAMQYEDMLMFDQDMYTRFASGSAGVSAAMARLRTAQESAACSGSSRRRRSNVRDRRAAGDLTCEDVKAEMKLLATRPATDMDTISTDEFMECASLLGKLHLPESHCSKLATKAITAYGEVSTWTSETLIKLNGLVSCLSKDQLMTLPQAAVNLDAMTALGEYGDWSMAEKSTIIADLFVKNQGGAANLTANAIISMGQAASGLSSGHIEALNKEAYCYSASHVGGLEHMEETQQVSWAVHAKACKGEVDSWSAPDVKAVGHVIGGLEEADLNKLTKVHIQEISPESINRMSPKQFAKLTPEQLGHLSHTQTQILTTEQLNSLSEEQRNSLTHLTPNDGTGGEDGENGAGFVEASLFLIVTTATAAFFRI